MTRNNKEALKPRGAQTTRRGVPGQKDNKSNIVQNSINNFFTNIQSAITSSITCNTINNISLSPYLQTVDSNSSIVDKDSIRVLSGNTSIDQPEEGIESTVDGPTSGKRRIIEEISDKSRPVKRTCSDYYSNHTTGSISAACHDDILGEQTTRQLISPALLPGPHILFADKGVEEENHDAEPPRANATLGNTGPGSDASIHDDVSYNSQSQTTWANVSSTTSNDTRNNILTPAMVHHLHDKHFHNESGVVCCTDTKQATGKRKTRRKSTRKRTPKAAILPQKRTHPLSDNVQENIQRLHGQFQIVKAKRRRLYAKEQSAETLAHPLQADTRKIDDDPDPRRLLPARECKRAAIAKIQEQILPFPKGAARKETIQDLEKVIVAIAPSTIPHAGLGLFLLSGPADDGSAPPGTRVATYDGILFRTKAEAGLM